MKNPPDAIRHAREQIKLASWLTTPARTAIEAGLTLLERQSAVVTFAPAAGRGWLVNGSPVHAGRLTACVSLAWCAIAFPEGAPVEMFAASVSSAANMLARARAWADRNAPELGAAFASIHLRDDGVIFEPAPDCPTIRVNAA